MFRPSTLAFWKAATGRQGGSVNEALHGLFYLTWPEWYIRVGLGRGRLSRMLRKPAWHMGKALGLWTEEAQARFADTYHGKVMPLPAATRLIRLDIPLNTKAPEKVLPFQHARNIILENPHDLVLLRCPCRSTAASPCLPLEVCIIVGSPVTDFVLEHHPEKTRRISVEEAVCVVEESQKRGHVSHAFFKEAVLGRYYAICNCCSCCCGAMQAHRNGTPMLVSSGYEAVVDEELCVGCGKCAAVCQFHALVVRDPGRGAALAVVGEACMGCGVCVMHCPKKAVELRRNPSRPAPLVVDKGTGIALEI